MAATTYNNNYLKELLYSISSTKLILYFTLPNILEEFISNLFEIFFGNVIYLCLPLWKE